MKITNVVLTLFGILLFINSVEAQFFIESRPPEDGIITVAHYTGGILSGISLHEYYKNTGETGSVVVSATKSANSTVNVLTGTTLRVILTFDVTTGSGSIGDYTEVLIKLKSNNGIQNFSEKISAFYTAGSRIYVGGSWITLPGTYTKLQIDTCTSVSITEWTLSPLFKLPQTISTLQNYPNPVNSSSTITFNLQSESFVSLKVFDFTGKEVALLISEEMPAGFHSYNWTPKNLPNGTYICRLDAGSFNDSKKLVILKE
jgi:hypothetical protein